MRRRSLVWITVFALGAGCTGDKGAPGDPGPQGDPGGMGDPGDPGPITDPPALTSLSPGWGSALTQVTIRGASFSATAADNTVTFNGYQANVLSATATELVVEPNVAVDAEMTVVVNVEVANQVSNGLTFELVPSGTARELPLQLLSTPTSVVGVGTDLYVAAGSYLARSAGLFKVNSNGVVSKLVDAGELTVSTGPGQTATLADGPYAVTTDGVDVFYLTLFGAVWKYEVASGAVSQILAPRLGDNSGANPPRSDLVFIGSVLYVVDRGINGGNGGILRLNADGSVDELADAEFGDGSQVEIIGVATDGTDLFVADSFDGEVHKVANPATSFDITGGFVTGTSAGISIAVVGSDLVVGNADGDLLSAPVASGGAASPYKSADGYAYPVTDMWVNGGGDLYMAQGQGGAVRTIASGSNTAEIVAAGVGLHFGAARLGNRWYFSRSGTALFGGTPSADAPDGAILELRADGRSKVVYTSALPTGLVASGSSELTVADCLEQRIFTLDPSTGTENDLLTSSDGLTCPGSMHLDGSGNLLYTNSEIGSPTPSTIGRLTSAGANNIDFVTGLPAGSVQMAVAGSKLVTSFLGPGMENGIDLWAAPVAGGAASLLVPAARAGGAIALGTSPLGSLYALRLGFGELIEIDPATGEVVPFGNALLPSTVLGPGGGMGSGSLTLAFDDDGTIIVGDFGQNAFIAVAP